MKKTMTLAAALLLVAAAPLWAANELDIVNPNDPGSQNPPDPNSPMWQGPEVVLYDNGPLVTNPGGAFGGADASVLQTNLLMNTLGFGHQFASGNSMADDFVVTDPAGWTINDITFFAYQSFSSTTSTITGVYVAIWDGDPSAGGSVIFGDQTTNRLLTTGWSNIYRVTDTNTATNTDRPIMADVATIGTTLAQGTYWVQWATDGTLSSGPWAPPISILGQTTTGNGIQYTGAWGPAQDSGTGTQQGFPFIINGDVVPVELQSFDIE